MMTIEWRIRRNSSILHRQKWWRKRREGREWNKFLRMLIPSLFFTLLSLKFQITLLHSPSCIKKVVAFGIFFSLPDFEWKPNYISVRFPFNSIHPSLSLQYKRMNVHDGGGDEKKSREKRGKSFHSPLSPFFHSLKSEMGKLYFFFPFLSFLPPKLVEVAINNKVQTL